MFECRACLLRCIRAIASDSPSATTRPLLGPPPIPNRLPLRRRLATGPASRKSVHDSNDDLAELMAVSEGTRSKQESTPKATVNEDEPDSFSDSSTSLYAARKATHSARPSQPIAIANEKALKKEIEWLQDPVKLADHVHYTLRSENPQKALDLCRLASKEHNAVVSWNHCIDWHMRHGKINEGIKIYNEMKKRGQHPDSHTYMMLLRGFPQKLSGEKSVEVRDSDVAKAVNIYRSMDTPTSRAKQSIMHTNAVLRTCAIARDMDALWSIASTIPEHGPGSADRVTYSILLGALKYGAFGKKQTDEDVEDIHIEALAKSRQDSINSGRRIWQEVIAKWRGGEIQVDEHLVNEMAHLLLFSQRLEDWDDVLSLIQQTTRVERLIAPVGSSERKTEHVPVEGEANSEPLLTPPDEEGWVDTPVSKVFLPIVSPPSSSRGMNRGASELVWVQPGNMILNAVLRACALMRIPKTAHDYWEKLTREYRVQPDRFNCHEMLRIYKLNRSSRRAADFVQEMHIQGELPVPYTYSLAMAVCQRDWKNVQNVMTNATAIVDDMEKRLKYPDPETLIKYLSLASRRKDGAVLVAALNRMDTFIHVLRSRITFGADYSDLKPNEAVLEKEKAIVFLRQVIGAIDVLMNKKLVPRKDFTHWHQRRAQLVSFTARASNNVERQKEKVRQLGGKSTSAEDREEKIHSELRLFRKDPTRRRFWKILPDNAKMFMDHGVASGRISGEEKERVKGVAQWQPPQVYQRLAGISSWSLAKAKGEGWDPKAEIAQVKQKEKGAAFPQEV